MVLSPAYFKHMQIVQKLEPTKFFPGITQFFPTRQPFKYYGTPDVPVNMVALYHHGLHSEKSMQHELISSNCSNMCPRGCGLKELENSKIRALKS